MPKILLVCSLLSWVVDSESSHRWWYEWGGRGSPKETNWGFLNHRSIWSYFEPKWKGRYPPCGILIPCDHHIYSIAWYFLFELMVAGPINMCLSMIIFRSPILVVKDLSFYWEFILWYPPLKLFGPLCFSRFLCTLLYLREMMFWDIPFFLDWKNESYVVHILIPGFPLILVEPVYIR